MKLEEFPFQFCLGLICGAYEAPILDVDRTLGYHGKINEKHVLVDMVPNLQVKNIESISMLLFEINIQIS